MATATTGSEENSRPGVVYTVVRHIFRTIVYTPIYAVGFGVICAAFTIPALILPGSEAGTMILLVILGWAIFAGQLEALGYLNDGESEERALPERIILGAVTGVYYNLMVLISVGTGFLLNTFGYPELAVAAVMLIPSGDIWMGRKFNTGLAYSMLSVAEWMGEMVMDAYKQIPAEKLIYSVIALVGSVKDALPPMTDHLALTSFSGRKIDRN